MTTTPNTSNSSRSSTEPTIVEPTKQGGTYVNLAPAERWLSTIAGGMLALIGVIGDVRQRRPSFAGVSLGLIGGWLTYRGVSGHCYIYQALDIDMTQQSKSMESIRFEKAMTINRSPEDMYLFWQDFDAMNKGELPKKTPQGTIDIGQERQHELDAWNKLRETVNTYSGYIHFEKAPNGRGTEVHIVITYTPPFGRVGKTVSKLTGKAPDEQVTEDLRHFKELLEAGEVPTTSGQPAGQ